MPEDGEPGRSELKNKQTDVLAAFHNHPYLELPGEKQWSLEQVVADDPDYLLYVLVEEKGSVNSEEYTIGDFNNSKSEIRIERNIDRSDDVIMEAIVSHTPTLSGILLNQQYFEFITHFKEDYFQISTTNNIREIAEIQIPTDYNRKTVEDTVDATVDLLITCVNLQNELISTLDSFELDTRSS